jgi:Ca-activated chloride channel family protein
MSFKRIIVGCGCALLSLAGPSASRASLHAQGWIEGGSIVRERSNVSVRVHEGVAAVEVEEWFRNRGAGLGEGDYMFPLPAGAVFASYSLFQGDKEMRGEVLDAAQARRVYEEIVRRKKDPALIELVGHGLVRARVFPIPPGETRRVVMRYTQPLQRAGDAHEFRYPARRNVDAASVGVVVTVDNGAMYRGAASPTHSVKVTRERGTMVIRPEGDVRSDFALTLPLAERDVGIAMSTHQEGDDDGFFMLRLTPGEATREVRVPRDVTVVLDVSGSMSGDKIDQAKAALRQLLGTLGNDDRFRLIKFNGSSTEWRNTWTRTTTTDISAANRWVDDLKADGGTNISEALADAFRVPSSAGRLPVVVFLTDGLPSVGETNPERIAALAERNSGGARVFAFGVGHDVNTYLLDRLGAAGRGTAQYVQPGESVETALGVLSAKIRYPVLTDLALSATGVALREIYPGTLPDLFGGEDLVVFGRYRTDRGFGGPNVRPVAGEVTVTGERNGRQERYATRVAFSSGEDGNDYMPRLWASRKLGELTRRLRLQGSSPELVEEIKSTALRYGLLSEYTSYFVTEPGAIVVNGDRNPLVPRDQVSSRAITTHRGSAEAPPAAQSGSTAVVAAEASRKQREASSAADVDAQQKAAAARLGQTTDALARVNVEGAVGSGRGGGAMGPQIIAGRSFTKRDSVWVDAGIDPKKKTLDVSAYSDAYFTLLRVLPELKAFTSLGDVAVAGSSVTIRIRTAAGSGVTQMTAAQAASLITEFRGTAGRL